MSAKPYLHILAPQEDKRFSNFYLYLGASEDAEDLYVQYRFTYEVNPIKPELGYDMGVNDPANRDFYRIREAYVVRKTEDGFIRLFRALQQGEIGFAMKEVGSGDYVGGFHGDEVLTEVRLTVDGVPMPLDKPFFGAFDSLHFYEQSHIFRCNTPEEKLVLHTQNYRVDGNTLRLSQDIEWITDAKPIYQAYMPMLTAQRLNPDKLDEILTETVEFYSAEGKLLATFDTTDYGADRIGNPSESVCRGTKATSVKVYGKKSGFMAEAGYAVREGICDSQIDTSLCIRHMRGALDNKIYFDIGVGTQPKAGDAWRSDVYYRLTYRKQ